jgi:hypothetical protein
VKFLSDKSFEIYKEKKQDCREWAVQLYGIFWEVQLYLKKIMFFAASRL